ncbi:MAG TPA: S8 family serine peptidase [Polyangiaceae bacterium]|jgi:subtilisin family serine protease|nr:S8 family serine peptidase [Polyangiaceae bacterium]
MTNGRFISWLAAFGLACAASDAAAEVGVHALAMALQGRTPTKPAPYGLLGGTGDLAAIVETPGIDEAKSAGLPALGGHFSVVRAPLADLDALALSHPDWKVTWSPPLKPLLDRAGAWINAPAYRNDTGLTGKNVIVGVIDTGADVTHPDLQNADGTTRIAYLVDFSQSARGTVPGAEARCTSAHLSCAVYTGAEIDQLVQSHLTSRISPDVVGHGTHVTSLAAGNGGAGKKYVGMAPEASIIVVRALDASNQIVDANLVSGADLIFWLAEQEGAKVGKERLPAVVNLSLGSDFGPHDGSTALERDLASMVGPDHPGRAIVVAAGNSAVTYDAGVIAKNTPYQSPLGIHTEVNVQGRTSVSVPMPSRPPTANATQLNGALEVWLSFRPTDNLSIGLDRNEGTWVLPVPPGSAQGSPNNDPLTETIINGVGTELSAASSDADGGTPPVDTEAAAVIIQGTWSASEVFRIRLEGHGTANLWLQGAGDLDPESGGGAFFPAATAQGTISIPAANASLIAAGATVNRVGWTDLDGDPISVSIFGAPDSLGFFSSAGPTADLRIKPDIVAPGAFVVGAMSRDANPSRSPVSIFAQGGGFCSPPRTTRSPTSDCALVDATHAIAVGTSMSSPITAGAIALLLANDPTLTEDRILTLLQAGARHPTGAVPFNEQVQLGAGVVDLEGSLDVARALANPVSREPVASKSWLTFGQSYAHPDPTWAVPALLQLRDQNARAADGFDPALLHVAVDGGVVARKLAKMAPGLYGFAVAASNGSGGANLAVKVTYGAAVLASAALPIGVDVNVVREGFSAQGGTCATGAPRSESDAGFVIVGALGFTAWRRRRSKRAVRRARSPGRMDSSARARPGSSRR